QFRIGLQQAQGDARVAVVEATADELAIDVEGIHDLAGAQARGRLLHDVLEDPGVAGTPAVLQLDGGVGGIHRAIVRSPAPTKVVIACLPYPGAWPRARIPRQNTRQCGGFAAGGPSRTPAAPVPPIAPRAPADHVEHAEDQ